MGKSIVVTSGKGGVGKTTCAANVAASLARRGKKVVVVDGDTGLRNLDIALRLEGDIVYNLLDVIHGKCGLREALVRSRDIPLLYLLPTAQAKDKTYVTAEDMCKITDLLVMFFDYVIIDCPAGIEQGFLSSITAASQAIVVVTPEIASIRDAVRVIAILENKGIKDVDIIVNKIRPNMVKEHKMLSIKDIELVLGSKVIAGIDDSDYVIESMNCGTFLSEMSQAGLALSDVVRNILGEDIEPEVKMGIIRRFIHRFRRQKGRTA